MPLQRVFMPIWLFNRWFSRPHALGIDVVACGDSSDPKDPEAQFTLAQQLGAGPDSDHARARQWYRQAAEQGHCTAQFHLALMYAQGKGGVCDNAAALKWLQSSAQGGHGGAQYHLGVRLYRASKSSTGPEASELRIESLRWLHQAVAQSWRGAEWAREFVLLGMTKREAADGEHRAHSSMANPAASTAALPVVEPL